MRPQKVLDIEILTGLTKVFRSKGYEGASLKDLGKKWFAFSKFEMDALDILLKIR